MVVAQIPLWIIHGTTPPGVDNLMMIQSHTKHTTTNNNATTPNTSSSTTENSNHNDTLNGKTQLNMWNNSSSLSSQKNDVDVTNNNNPTTKKIISERRSAIYCCDISNPLPFHYDDDMNNNNNATNTNKDKFMGRIATGGGDGKIRIWNLVSLFQTSKMEPNEEENEGDDNEEEMDIRKRRRIMGTFKTRGGYESSDSSECSKSSSGGNSTVQNDYNHSITQKHDEEANDDMTNNNNNNNDKKESDKRNNGTSHHESTNTTVTDTTSSLEQINDISSLIKRKETTSHTVEDKNGKKRKRVELIQVVRPPPQATTSKGTKPNNTSTGSTQNGTTTTSTTATPSHKQRLLCTIASHSGSVLTLRFSSSGLYLASAGDDAHVLIYTRTNTPSLLSTGNLLHDKGGSNSGGGENVEHWERIRILRGHNLDVVGLAWAPDDSHLISCSLDSDAPICVWRLNLDSNLNNDGNRHLNIQKGVIGSGSSNSTLHPYKVLGRSEHTSTVKGVAFDPAGKYFASSGDDPAICIWRAFDDWGLEARVDSSSGVFRSKKKNSDDGGAGGDDRKVGGGEEDMQALANLSLFRRISFAPDGTHVCGTNATLRGKNIAAMISRNGWGVSAPKKGQSCSTSGAANLVGHKQPVVSSRHCPYFFEVDRKKGSEEEQDDVEPTYSTLVALGDKKGFISIWSTKKSRPIFKLQCSESRCTGMFLYC